MAQKPAFRPFRAIQYRILRRSQIRRTFLFAVQAGSSLVSAEIEVTLAGMNAKSAAGKTLSESKVGSGKIPSTRPIRLFPSRFPRKRKTASRL